MYQYLLLLKDIANRITMCACSKMDAGSLNHNNNTRNLSSAYPVAQSTEQYRLNTYMYIEIKNVVKKRKENVHISTQLDDIV